MKVLDLHCAQGHGFEGWFASEQDFQDQLARGLVECPVCEDHHIAKKPSAPRLNLGAGRDAAPPAAAEPHTAASAQQAVALAGDAQAQAAWFRLARQVLAHTEDVGERFVEEARRIHYGESRERGIRGQASQAQTLELLEEGIGVLPLALPKALKGPLQ